MDILPARVLVDVWDPEAAAALAPPVAVIGLVATARAYEHGPWSGARTVTRG